MAVDPSILVNGYRPQQIEAPINALSRVMELNGMQQRNALAQAQFEDMHAQRQQTMQQAQALAQFRQSVPSPQMAAGQQAMAGGGGPTMANAQRVQPVDPRLQMMHQAMQAGAVSPMDYLKEAYPQPDYATVKPGESIINRRNNQVLFSAPDKANVDPFMRLLVQANIDPASPQGQKLIQDRLAKESTHQPPVSLNNYGSPLPIQLPGGGTGYIQPPTRPGGPTQVLTVPGTGAPALKPNEPKQPPVEFTKSVAGLNELTNGLSSYEKTLKDEGGIGPLSTGEKRAKLQASYTSLQMGLKNAFELGALAGPDLGLLQGMLIDPTSPRAVLVGDKGVAAQIAKAREYVTNRTKAVYDAHKQPVPASAPSAGGVVNFSDLK
jgi:hypothetical protein